MNKKQIKIDKLIEQGNELIHKHEELRNEIINNPDIPEILKEIFIGLGEGLKPALNLLYKQKEKNEQSR